ncbi:MAG: hypothetical protein WA885_01900 [Phormidesmis sp.]
MLKFLRVIGLALILAAPPFISGCQPETNLSETSTLPTEKSPAKGAKSPIQQSAATRKVTFRQPGGAPQFSLQFKPTGGKLVDESGKAIANLILQSDGAIRLTDTNNQTVGYIVRGNTWQIESPKRTKTLFTFVQDGSGNATLLRGDGSVVYQLNAKGNGYVVEADKTDRYTVNASKGTGQLQTTAGETLLISDSAIAPIALASFGFTKLTQAQQAGLAYALSAETP